MSLVYRLQYITRQGRDTVRGSFCQVLLLLKYLFLKLAALTKTFNLATARAGNRRDLDALS